MTLQLRDQENREIGREEGRVESLNNLLKFNPQLSVDAGAEMVGLFPRRVGRLQGINGQKNDVRGRENRDLTAPFYSPGG